MFFLSNRLWYFFNISGIVVVQYIWHREHHHCAISHCVLGSLSFISFSFLFSYYFCTFEQRKLIAARLHDVVVISACSAGRRCKSHFCIHYWERRVEHWYDKNCYWQQTAGSYYLSVIIFDDMTSGYVHTRNAYMYEVINWIL